MNMVGDGIARSYRAAAAGRLEAAVWHCQLGRGRAIMASPLSLGRRRRFSIRLRQGGK